MAQIGGNYSGLGVPVRLGRQSVLPRAAYVVLTISNAGTASCNGDYVEADFQLNGNPVYIKLTDPEDMSSFDAMIYKDALELDSYWHIHDFVAGLQSAYISHSLTSWLTDGGAEPAPNKVASHQPSRVSLTMLNTQKLSLPSDTPRSIVTRVSDGFLVSGRNGAYLPVAGATFSGKGVWRRDNGPEDRDSIVYNGTYWGNAPWDWEADFYGDIHTDAGDEDNPWDATWNFMARQHADGAASFEITSLATPYAVWAFMGVQGRSGMLLRVALDTTIPLSESYVAGSRMTVSGGTVSGLNRSFDYYTFTNGRLQYGDGDGLGFIWDGSRWALHANTYDDGTYRSATDTRTPAGLTWGNYDDNVCSCVVSLAVTGLNGVYTRRGMYNSSPYYNLEGHPDNPEAFALAINGSTSKWELRHTGITDVAYRSVYGTTYPFENPHWSEDGETDVGIIIIARSPVSVDLVVESNSPSIVVLGKADSPSIEDVTQALFDLLQANLTDYDFSKTDNLITVGVSTDEELPLNTVSNSLGTGIVVTAGQNPVAASGTLTYPAVQTLNAPGRGALLVTGTVDDGEYTRSGGRYNGKFVWGKVDSQFFWDGSQWVFQPFGADPLCYSLSDTPTPLTATGWKNISDDTAVAITITLTDPQGGLFVLGGPLEGLYIKQSAFYNGKAAFGSIATAPGNFDPSYAAVAWTESFFSLFGSHPDLNGVFYIVDESGAAVYYSISDVITPDLVPPGGWLNVSDDTPADITVTSVSVGELAAGATVAGAGTSAVNGAFSDSGLTFQGRKVHKKIGADIYSVFNGSWGINDGPTDEATAYYGDGDFLTVPFFHQMGAGSIQTGTPPAPTVTLNNVAVPENWQDDV